jgi:selenocysteine lyase/cysteine desulfurase
MAGVTAAVDYLASLATTSGSRRDRLDAAYASVTEHETSLGTRFLDAMSRTPAIRVYGVPEMGPDRCATFALSVAGRGAAEVADALGRQGIYVWSGSYYAVNVMDRLGVADQGGLVRVGFVHYNTTAEVDRVAGALHGLAG